MEFYGSLCGVKGTRGWLGVCVCVRRNGDKSARMNKCLFIGPVVLPDRGMCCNFHKSTPDKPGSVTRGGVNWM